MKLFRFAFAALMLTTTNAAATDEGSYLALRGGLTSPLDLDYSRPFTSNSVDTDYKEGQHFSVGYGTHLGMARVELEGLFQQADVDTHEVSGFSSDGSRGAASIAALMVNGYVDFSFGNMTLKPYVGVGLGGAYVTYNKQRTDSINLVDDSKGALAYQGMAGVRYNLNAAWDLTAEYRYFSTEGLNMLNGEDVDYKAHSVVAGVSRKF